VSACLSASRDPARWLPPSLSQPPPREGYRFSTDAFVLASFAAAFKPRFWCDLGAGSGVIAHALTQLSPGSRGVAVERQAESLAHARRNLRNAPCLLVEGDLRHFPWRPNCFDLAVCNPPYYEVARGHVNRNPVIAEARHAYYGDVTAFAEAMRPAMRADGVFCFIYPFVIHRPVLGRLREAGWRLKRRLALRPFAGREPKLVCFALDRLRGGPDDAPECLDLVQFRAHRVFTEAMHRFLLGRNDWR